jgi:hypothetical protein
MRVRKIFCPQSAVVLSDDAVLGERMTKLEREAREK